MAKLECPIAPNGWEIMPQFQTGDVVHVQSIGLISRLIRWFSESDDEREKTWASHSALVLKHIAEPIIIEALATVKVRPIRAYQGKKSRLIVTRKPGGLTEEEQRKAFQKAEEYKGREYGYLKIVAHVLDRLFNNAYVFRRLAQMDDYPICSWLVAFVYDRTVGLQFGVPPNAAQPDDIMDFCVANNWEFVWCDSQESLQDFCDTYNRRAK